MDKKTVSSLGRIILVSFVMLFSVAAMSSATNITWDNGNGDQDWNNPLNWVGHVLPTTALGQYARITGTVPGPVFNGETADVYRIYLEGSNGTLTMNSGSLTTVNHIYTAAAATDTATINMSGGEINIGDTFYVARDSGSNAAVNISGGDISCNLLSMNRNLGAVGTIDLSGGTITCNTLTIYTNANGGTVINITATGTLIIDNNGATEVTSYIANGWIQAYDGAGTVMVDVNNINPDKTTVWAASLTKPGLPLPADNATNVSRLADLSWIGMLEANSHNVYFGTSSSPAFVGNQTETTFETGILEFDTTYYWRIDEIIGSNTVTGDLWTFSTVSRFTQTPNPAGGATEVALNKVLSWTPGYGAVSHDVYLGTDAAGVGAAQHIAGDIDRDGQVDYNDLFILTNYWLANPAGSEPYAGVNDDDIVDFNDYVLLAQNWMASSGPLFKGNTTGTIYNDPCDFAVNTVYYWRVDEVNGIENHKGDVWNFTTTIYSDSLIGKVMCGYQGWFNCPDDGSNPARGWVHWGAHGNFSPTDCTVDFWPDMTEYSPSEKFLASAFYDGNDYYVFSSHNLTTVRRHFQWMADYGIDGVYLQRFANEVRKQTDSSFFHRNDVLDYCKDAANLYGRKYAVMYDLSGLRAGRMQSVIDDWKYLVDTMNVTRDPADNAYMHHRGKPVVAVWGIGFADRSYTLAECLSLVDFLRNDPVYGGNIVMVGVPSHWRTLDQDCLPDANVHTIIRAADIVSPWSVGRYSNLTGVTIYADDVWTPDVNWCQTNSTPSHPIEYLPVIWPGYSFHNAAPDTKPFNEIPRNGGQFFWDQVNAAVSAANAQTNMLYIAMFDEVDEGTAIFKVTNNPPRPGGVDMFLTPSYDGIPLPSDEYLWLTGQAGMALRGEIPVNATRPPRP
jgi:glycoprotein endo-alpha-1,2-mannosidase